MVSCVVGSVVEGAAAALPDCPAVPGGSGVWAVSGFCLLGPGFGMLFAAMGAIKAAIEVPAVLELRRAVCKGEDGSVSSAGKAPFNCALKLPACALLPMKGRAGVEAGGIEAAAEDTGTAQRIAGEGPNSFCLFSKTFAVPVRWRFDSKRVRQRFDGKSGFTEELMFVNSAR